jgi:hypothetical protein
MIAVLVAVLVVLLLGVVYYTYTLKNRYDLLKQALGDESSKLENTLLKVQELQNKNLLSQTEIENNRKIIEEQKNKVQQLADQISSLNTSVQQKDTDLAYARKTIFEANDYLLDTYMGPNKEGILRLRRLRDLILLNVNNLKRGLCTFSAKPGLERLLKELSSSEIKGFGTVEQNAQTLANALAIEKAYQAAAFAWYNSPQSKTSNSPIAVGSSPIITTVAFRDRTPEEQNAFKILEMSRPCTIPLKGSLNMFRQSSPFLVPYDWSALMDEIENILISMQSKMCVGVLPDLKLIGVTLQTLYDSFCGASDSTINGLLNKPLDFSLAKSSVLFL